MKTTARRNLWKKQLVKVIATDTLIEFGEKDGVPYRHEHARPGDVGVICEGFVDYEGEVTCFWERTGTITTCDEEQVTRVRPAVAPTAHA